MNSLHLFWSVIGIGGERQGQIFVPAVVGETPGIVATREWPLPQPGGGAGRGGGDLVRGGLTEVTFS